MPKGIVVILLLSSFAFGFDSALSLESGFNDLKGAFTFKNASKSTDLTKELKQHKSDTAFKPSLSFGSDRHRFHFAYEKFTNTSHAKLTDDILYNGMIFASRTFVNSKITMSWAQAQYLYRIDSHFALGVSIDGIKLDSILSSDMQGQHTTYKKILILPGIDAEAKTSLFEGCDLIARLSSANALSDGNSFYAYGGLAYTLPARSKYFCCTRLHLGYQYKKLTIDDDTLRADFRYSGLYVGIGITF